VVGINTSSYDNDEDQNTNFAEQVKFVCRVLELMKQEKDPSSVKVPFNFLTDPFKSQTMVVSNVYLNDGFIDLQVGDKIIKVMGYGPLKNEGDLIHALRGRADAFSLGLVLLYKNNAGTNALNSDIICRVSANNGANYTACVLAAKGTFGTGILIAVAPAVTVTSGTQLKYKVEFSSQASGSKEARVHGVAMTY
jgi:hypothetical protein